MRSYDQMNEGFSNNHVDQIIQVLTPDYKQSDPTGHVLDKDGTRKKLQGERNSIRTLKTICQLTKITPDGIGVEVEVHLHSEGTGFKHVLFMNIGGTFTYDMVAHDLWVNTAEGWRMQSRQMLVDDSRQHAA